MNRKTLTTLFKTLMCTLLTLVLTGCSTAGSSGYLTNDVSAETLTSLFNFNFSFGNSDFFTAGGLTIDSVFKYFNLTLLSSFGLIVAFIVISGTIYSAQDGQFLGKKWSSTWLPLRTVAGSILIIPFKSGLCLAQYVVVMMVTVGIVGANMIWENVAGTPAKLSAPTATIAMHDQLKNNLGELLFSLTLDNISHLNVDGDANSTIVNPTTGETCGTTSNGWQLCCQNSNGDPSGVKNLCTLTESNYHSSFLNNPSQAKNWVQTHQNILLQLANTASAQSFCKTASGDSVPACITAINDLVNNDMGSISSILSDSGYTGQTPNSPFATNGTLTPNSNPVWAQLSLVGDGAKSATYTFHVVPLAPPTSQSNQLKIGSSPNSNNTATLNQAIATAEDSTYEQINTIAQQLAQNTTPVVAGNANPTLDNITSNTVAELIQIEANAQAQSAQSPSQNQATPSKGTQLAIPTCGNGNTGSLAAGGWWCAGSRYLNVDSALANNLGALQNAITAFSDPSTDNARNISISLTDPYIAMAYSMYPVSGDTVSTTPNPALHYSVSSPKEIPYTLPTTDKNNLDIGAWSGSVNASGSNNSVYYELQNFNPCSMTKKPYASGWGASSCQINAPGDPLSAYQQLRAMFPSPNSTQASSPIQLSGLEAPYAARIMLIAMMYNIVNGTQTLTASNGQTYTATIGLTPDEVSIIYNTLTYLKNNGIAYNYQSNPNYSAKVVGSPLYGVITGIFNELLSTPADSDFGTNKTDTNPGGQVSNILTQIYDLGMTNSNGQGLVADHLSTVEQAEAIGFNTLEGTLSVMKQIFSFYVNELNTIKSQAESDASSLTGWQVAAGFIPFLKGTAAIKTVDDQVSINVMLAGIATTLMWLPLAIFVLLAVFVAGISFAFLVPMIPFVLFWAGKVAWILLIIEALIAAPIMALGLAYPDGHDIWGQAEPGVKMSLNLMLMPMLMIIGLLVGMILTYVIIHFTATSFHAIASQIIGMLPSTTGGVTATVSLAQGTVALVMILVYSSFMVMAFEKCFAPIYQLPERVLQWIGGQMGVKFGEQSLGQFKQATQQDAKEMGQAGGQGLEKGIQAQQGSAKAQSDGDLQVAGAYQNIGQGVTQGIQEIGSALGGGG